MLKKTTTTNLSSLLSVFFSFIIENCVCKISNLWPMGSGSQSPSNLKSLQSCYKKKKEGKQTHARRRIPNLRLSWIRLSWGEWFVYLFILQTGRNQSVDFNQEFVAKETAVWIVFYQSYFDLQCWDIGSSSGTPLFCLCDVCCHTTLPPIFNSDALRDGVGKKRDRLQGKPW